MAFSELQKIVIAIHRIEGYLIGVSHKIDVGIYQKDLDRIKKYLVELEKKAEK